MGTDKRRPLDIFLIYLPTGDHYTGYALTELGDIISTRVARNVHDLRDQFNNRVSMRKKYEHYTAVAMTEYPEQYQGYVLVEPEMNHIPPDANAALDECSRICRENVMR